MNIPSVTLLSGYDMPVLGLGTWQSTGKECEQAVRKALDMGYRHIDTSDDYKNEQQVGKAVKDFNREELFITTKVDDSKLKKDALIKACNDSLKRLGIKYVDLYLIHRPNPTIPLSETMRGMKELVDRGLVRSIGISNFHNSGTEAARSASDVPISVNQIKIHPYHYPHEEIKRLQDEGIAVTAYSPLDTGQLINDDLLSEIGEKYGKSAAQVSLNWLLSQNLVVIPKARSEEHLRENMDIFDWKLSEDDSQLIAESGNLVLRG